MRENKNRLTRHLDAGFKRENAEDNPRRFLLSFSSEEPVYRYGEAEILDHAEDAVDLYRLNEIGVVLFNHNQNMVLARVEKAWLENGRGQAYIVFDEDEDAEKIRIKVETGTLRGVSVRYKVSNWEEVGVNAKSTDGRFSGPARIARRWTPLEISVVSIPADATVGVQRDLEGADEPNMGEEKKTIVSQAVAGRDAAQPEPTQPPIAERAASEETIREQEAQRTADIMELCREFGMEEQATGFIREQKPLDLVRAAVLDEMKKKWSAVPVTVEKDEGDKYRETVTDGLLLRGGVAIKDPAAGAEEFRGMSIRDMMNDCARREGIQSPERIDPIDLMRQYFTPASAFPSILDQAINKAYVAGYNNAPVTFDVWTVKGTLTDFKPTRSNYRQGNAGELLLVPEGGELKQDKIADHLLPQRKLNTFGRQFTLSREAIINDDIGLVTSLPARYATSARRTINKQVYAILANNAVIYDGTPMFTAAHGNLVGTGTIPTLKSLQQMINMLMLMKDENGDPIAGVPRYVVVPIGLGDAIRQIIGSQTIVVESASGTLTTQANPLLNRGLVVVEDAYLNTLTTDAAIAWYLVADPSIVPTIQVDYLNGQEIPTIRRMEYPGQLGYIWDIYHDWGVTVLDYRGIIKNPGSNA